MSCARWMDEETGRAREKGGTRGEISRRGEPTKERKTDRSCASFSSSSQRASGVEYRRKLEMMAQAQGAAIPAKLDIERQILSQVERLPGPIESKRLGLQIMTGEIDRFGFEDYLNQASMREEGPRADTHSIMEAKLNLGPNVGRF